LVKRAYAEAITPLSYRLETSGRAPYGEYKGREVEFMTDVLGWTPWGKEDSPTGGDGQREWIRALLDDHFLAVAGCNGSGKSTLAAALALMFVETRAFSKVITMAPKWEQVTKLIWAKLRAMHAESKQPLHGSPLTYQWELEPEWGARGFSTDSEIRAQGIHTHTTMDGEEGDLLAIFDEASGIAPFAFNAMRGWLTKGNCYILLIGNTNEPQGPFYEAFEPDSVYKTFKCSAFDCPDWIVSPEWIEMMKQECDGEDDPQWQIRVLAEFPSSGGTRQLFPRSILRGALEGTPAMHSDLHVGVDVARHGHDKNVVTLTQGDVVKRVESWSTPDLMETAKNLIMLLTEWGIEKHQAKNVHIDLGMGAGVIDRLAEAGWGVDSVGFGSKPRGEHKRVCGRMKFRNRKAELHWAARRMLQTHQALIPEEFTMTWRQLQWLEYDFTAGTDLLQVEPKNTLAKRGITESPDFADSWILTFSRTRSGGGVFWV